MTVQEILSRFHSVAANPSAQKDAYLAAGKKIVLTAPVYTPDEIIHSMGLVPMGAWGADVQLEKAKSYFPAFICSISSALRCSSCACSASYCAESFACRFSGKRPRA